MARTPLLVPSFSSKGIPNVEKILRTAEEVIEGEMLISAYDIYYGKIKPPFDFASMVFLDSGGYEVSKDAELSDVGDHPHSPQNWSTELHKSVLDKWKSNVPTVFISYDHPRERLSVKDRIARARKNLNEYPDVFHEILLKPETFRQNLLKVNSILPYIDDLAEFDAIGVTEKEIGNSVLTRMNNIATIRKALSVRGLETPIHVFGSLDTITTPLYFVAGADIFDGLTWLRYAYKDGYTIYKQNYGALFLGSDTTAHMIDGRCWFSNYYYLKDMELEMRMFLNNHDFSCFKYHADRIRECYENTIEAMEA